MLTSPAEYAGKARAMDVRQKLVALSIEGRRSARHHEPRGPARRHGRGPGDQRLLRPQPGLVAWPWPTCEARAAQAPAFVVKAAKADLAAAPTDLPFYKEGTARKKLA